ncbi:hypothetical protein BJ912DRAFT_1034137 [Pholiota molesta]|nr:hypothetical protein BJ912DRAFT_1034137 [Pholiota molesta]
MFSSIEHITLEPLSIIASSSFRVCLEYSLSKGVGIGIVLGGSIMKVPQKFPKTYGENLVLTLRNTIINLLILAYSPIPSRSLASPGTRKSQTIAFAAVASPRSRSPSASFPTTTTTLPLSLFSKLRQNMRAHSIGQPIAFTVPSQIAGCLARLFTAAQEVGDPLVAAGFLLALTLVPNAMPSIQLWIYWGLEEVSASSHIREKEKEQENHYAPAAWEANATEGTIHALAGAHVSTPPLRTLSSGGGRKWARQVD